MSSFIRKYVRYGLYGVLFVVFAAAEQRTEIRAFSVGLFMALVYGRENLFILAPLYIAAGIGFDFSLTGAVIAVAPVVVTAAAFFLHYRFKRKVKMYNIAVYTLLSQIPAALMSAIDITGLINTGVSIIAGQVFAYLTCIIVSRLKKGLRYKLTGEEKLAVFVFLAALGYALFGAEISFFSPFYAVLAFGVLASVYIEVSPLLLASALAVGGGAASGQTAVFAVAGLYALAAIGYNRSGIIYAAIAVTLIDIIANLFFTEHYELLGSVSPLVGAVAFVAVPDKYRTRLDAFSVGFGKTGAARSLVNRDRRDVGRRLGSLAGVFLEMQEILLAEVKYKSDCDRRHAIARDVVEKTCGNCLSEANCNEALGGSTEPLIFELITSADRSGKATILDTPAFLSSHCKKINGLLTAVNRAATAARERQTVNKSLTEGRAIIGEQMGGVGRLLEELRRDVEKSVSYDRKLEMRIIDALADKNIAATEVVVYNNAEGANDISVFVRDADAAKSALVTVVSEAVGAEMCVSATENSINDTSIVHLERSPVYGLVYGYKYVGKEADATGDKARGVKLSSGKAMLMLADGMGSGAEAARESNNAVNIIEKFYKAGFDHSTVLSSAAKLLALEKTESFNAVDLAIFDVMTGTVDFVKLGGRESFIYSMELCEVVECGSLPLGILEEAVPIVETRALSAPATVVMVTDGVIDVLGRELLIELIESQGTANPSELAEAVIENTVRLRTARTTDDAGCLVVRIFKR